MSAIAYTSYIGRGNLGDDLCLDVFRAMAGSGHDIRAATPADPGPGQTDVMRDQVESADRLVIGGGSLLTYDYYLTMAALAAGQGKPVHFWGAGLDGLGLDTAVALAENRKLTAAQFGQLNVELLKSAVGAAADIHVRGPVTKDALSIIHPALSRARVVGDPGLAVEPEEGLDAPVFHGGKPVAAVNWGAIDDESACYGGDGRKAAGRFFDTLDRLADRYAFFFFPMIARDTPVHENWAEQLRGKTEVYTLETTPSAPALCGALGRCDVVLGRKLHAQALAHAAGTPCVAYAYRGKCYDLAASVDCVDLVVHTGDGELESKTVRALDRIGHDRDEIIKKVAEWRAVYVRRLRESVARICAD